MRAQDPSTQHELPWRSSLATALILGALCMLTFGLKLNVAANREVPGHGDVSHYFALARGLFEGRGMWMQRIATWLSEPTGLPVYGAGYWMPLSAWIGELGMLVRGEASFRAAGDGMLVLTSTIPLLTYLIGRDLFDNARAGLAGAVLATSFHLFLDKATLPLTHGGALVFGGFALWAIVRSLNNRRALWLAGFMIALSQLNRSDGLLWIPALLVAHRLRSEGPTPWRQLWPAALTYALTIAPFLAFNLHAIGRLWPASLLDVALLPSYSSLYALPSTLSLENYLEPGLGHVLSQKLSVTGTNALAFATGLATSGRSGNSGSLPDYALYALVIFSWLGARPLLSRRLVTLWAFLFLEWALYSLLFTHTGHTSFESILFAIYPVLLVLAARGIWIVSGGRETPLLSASKPKAVTFVAFAFVLLLANFEQAQHSSARRVAANQRLADLNRAQAQRLIRRNGLESEVFFVSPSVVHSLHAHTRIRTVSIPTFASAREIWEAGQRVGVTYALVREEPEEARRWNAFAMISNSERFELIDRAEFNAAERMLYRLVPPNE